MTTIVLTDEADRWRYRCPRNHTTWEPTNHHFWCASCARSNLADASFDYLRDAETGKEYERHEIRLETETGPYDREVDA